MDWLVRPGPTRAAALTALFSRVLRKRAIPAGEVWMSDDGSACAVWLPPGLPPAPVSTIEQLKLLPFFVKVCGFQRLGRGAAISGAMEKAHPRENHFYLYFMAVDPALQGRGLGAAILGATLARTTRSACPPISKIRIRKTPGSTSAPALPPGKASRLQAAPPLIPMWHKQR